jgi:hypothetical protein
MYILVGEDFFDLDTESLKVRSDLTTRGFVRRVSVKLKKTLTKLWRLWAKSLGEKVGETDRQADSVAVIRTIWWLVHMVTCVFIILNAIANHGWGLVGL